MEILCTERFKTEYEKVMKHNSYKQYKDEFQDYFFNTTPPAIYTGDLLNASNTTPYIKKRLKSGGLRVYFFAIIKDAQLILLYLHPKSGKYGRESATGKEISLFLKEGIAAFKKDEYYKLQLVNKEISFSKYVPVEV